MSSSLAPDYAPVELIGDYIRRTQKEWHTGADAFVAAVHEAALTLALSALRSKCAGWRDTKLHTELIALVYSVVDEEVKRKNKRRMALLLQLKNAPLHSKLAKTRTSSVATSTRNDGLNEQPNSSTPKRRKLERPCLR
ncbi:hypothetical protein EG327_004839 [Venturia inaequalis]|uniref:Uncharacterized protein n=1 Tax=Venturia inaequalis TaxID=5025 RepID=A0A8H3VDG0_VENIN|nr:hypothetical protein EG327_004839 [Venturia inaequalis]